MCFLFNNICNLFTPYNSLSSILNKTLYIENIIDFKLDCLKKKFLFCYTYYF